MIDAFTRAMRKPQQVLGYEPGLTAAPGHAPLLPGTRLRREPDGPVSMKIRYVMLIYIFHHHFVLGMK